MLKYFRNSLILTSILYTLLGLVLIIAPGKTLRLTCTLIGVVTVWYGLSKIIACRKYGMTEEGQPFDLSLGVVLLALGLLLLISPQFIVSIIPVALGIYILVDSVSAIKRAQDMKALGFDKWWASLLAALALAAFGVVIILNPFGAVETLIAFVGAGFVFDGVSTLINTVISDRIYKGR
ncbi:DUF308 domain-containing protein [Acutalibacter muris]|nr:DUF308 domain-containing protein [Acutalibacter muris]MCI9193056.1 hypothetical protein [Acutalibacter muris]MCI9544902.1 hypothetical protein [Acutalibacter muris]QQR31885.1 DUF308 domain-containing protein [Acutalibacter muris]